MTPEQILWMGFGAIAAGCVVAVLGTVGALINHWTRELAEDALMDTAGARIELIDGSVEIL